MPQIRKLLKIGFFFKPFTVPSRGLSLAQVDLHPEEKDVGLQVVVDRVAGEDLRQGGVLEGGQGRPILLLLVSLVLFTDMAGYDLVVPILPEYARSWGIHSLWSERRVWPATGARRSRSATIPFEPS